MLTVACVWIKSEVFDSPEWVIKLYSMVHRRIGLVNRPYRFVCITNENECFPGYDIEVVKPTIHPPSNVKNHWYKVNLFNLSGEKILYFDLDIVITNSIVPLIEFPSDFVVAPSSGVPMNKHDFNSSVMMWYPDSDPIQHVKAGLSKIPFIHYAGDQQWLSSLPIRVDLYPSRWISKYIVKNGVKPPSNESIVSLLIQGGKNKALIDSGHSWIAEYWK